MAHCETFRRSAVVTGSDCPAGRLVLARLQADGYRVAGFDESGGAGDLPVRADMTDRQAVARAVDAVVAEMGPIAVLVTVSGCHDAAPFGELSRDRWRRLLDAQLGGTVNACAAVLPAMVDAGAGRVVTTCSWLALAGIDGEAYAAAATGSILAFTKSLSLEVAPCGIRVNCVVVGPQAGHLIAVADTVSFLADDADGGFFVGQLFTPAAGALV